MEEEEEAGGLQDHWSWARAFTASQRVSRTLWWLLVSGPKALGDMVEHVVDTLVVEQKWWMRACSSSPFSLGVP